MAMLFNAKGLTFSFKNGYRESASDFGWQCTHFTVWGPPRRKILHLTCILNDLTVKESKFFLFYNSNLY